MKISYVLASFPNNSETFILNEIAEAVRQGMDIRVYSLLRPDTACIHEVATALMGRVVYCDHAENASLTRLVLLHLRFLLLYHRHYVSALLFALRHRGNAMLWTFKVVVLCVRQMRRDRPELLHTHFAYDSSRLTMLAAKMMGVPYTLTIHGWGDLYDKPPTDLGLIIGSSKRTITVCDYNRCYIMETYAIPEEKIAVVRCGISQEFFCPVDHSKRVPGLIVSVGRLHYHKAYHVLIDACRRLADRGIAFRCVIIGDGALRDELQQQIEALELHEKVKLIGATSSREVREWMRRAEVFAMSSAVETVGLAAVEALASEIPVVATGIFGVPEMVREGETGFLCTAGDPLCIAEKLERALSLGQLGREMGERGRILAAHEHNLAIQVNKLVGHWSA